MSSFPLPPTSPLPISCQSDPPGATGLFLPASELKAARRAAADALIDARRRHPYAESLAAESVVQQLVTEPFTPAATAAATAGGKGWAAAATAPPVPAAAAAAGGKSAPSALPPPRLRLLCRSRAQVDAALRVPWLDELVLDFLEVHGLKEAVASVRAAGRRVVVATPRVLKPDEERLWLFYLRLGADALLLRSAGLLTRLLQLGGPGAAVPDVPHPVPRLEGDFSLNAANAIATRLLLSSGLDRVAPTHDLNASQLAALGRNLGAAAAADHLELILHQHMPIFHTGRARRHAL